MSRLPAPAALTDLVWLQTGFIGDVLLTSAAIELAAAAFPKARQHLVTTPVGAKVMAGSPALARDGAASLIVFDKAERGAVAAFRAVRSALAAAGARGPGALLLQPHRSHRSSLLARYLGLPTVTFRESGFAALADRRVARVAVLHEAARIGLLLEPLGVARAAITAARPRLAPLPLDAAAGGWQAALAAHRARGGKVVAVAPGSVWGTKRWTPAGFAALLDGLLADPDVLAALIGSGAEVELARQLAATVPAAAASRCLMLAGATSLDDLRRLMPALSLLVSNDSSPIHYAAAFAVPTVALFGATVPGMGFAPLAPGSVSLGTDQPCRPCSDHGPMTCPLGHFKCMKELAADRVLAACRQVLRSPARPAAN